MEYALDYFFLMLGLLGLVILIWIVKSVSGLSNRAATFDENRFSQAGVTVNFAAQTIEIKGKTFPITSVRGLRWEATKLKGSTGRVGNDLAASFSHAYVEVFCLRRNDLKG